MKIILQQAQGEITEKKSRFIATLCPVQSQEEAEQFIAACKRNTGMQGTTAALM